VRRSLLLLTTAALVTGVLPATAAHAKPDKPGKPYASSCASADRISVPGAEVQRVSSCLDDLSTTGLLAEADWAYTDAADFASLHAPGTVNPPGVPGVQVDGYFPDSSTTNTLHGWNHDSQFVIRLPDEWNGRLVVAGAPGVRKQYSSDFLISDQVTAQGYAYASIDKGNTGAFFFRDGEEPGDAMREWHERVTQVAEAAQAVVRQAYGKPARHTYMTGISNGGYLTRWQLENRPGVFDGGVDWEGTLFEDDNNLFTQLPPALQAYPTYRDAPEGSAEKEAARQQILAAGFEEGSEFLWPLHYSVYWDLTQRIYREELDPAYDGALEAGGTPSCPLGVTGCAESDIEYDAAERAAFLEPALRGLTLTGKLKRPMLSLHGTLDTLLPISTHGDRYAELVGEQKRTRLHRYYVVERGQHVDGFYAIFGDAVRPILPCYRDAFEALVAWVEDGVAPPPSGTVEPLTGPASINECTL
jgi:hypothetical protein